MPDTPRRQSRRKDRQHRLPLPRPEHFEANYILSRPYRVSFCFFATISVAVNINTLPLLIGSTITAFQATMALPPTSQRFPDRPQFSGFMKPCRVEGEVQNLEVYGEIPADIDGTFYRVMPDPQLPPFIEDDPVCTYTRLANKGRPC